MDVREAQHELVIRGYVPVEAGQQFVVGCADIEAAVAPRVVAVVVGEELLDGLHLRRGGPRQAGTGTKSLRSIVARLNRDSLGDVGGVFGVEEEEEFVFDDGSAKGQPYEVVERGTSYHRLAAYKLSTDVAARDIVINRSMEEVGTMLGDHIEDVSVESRIADIEGGEADVEFLDGIKGDGVEIIESEFLPGFAVQGLLHIFAITDMTADGGVPAPGHQVLVETPVLEENVGHPVDYVKMNDRVHISFGVAYGT